VLVCCQTVRHQPCWHGALSAGVTSTLYIDEGFNFGRLALLLTSRNHTVCGGRLTSCSIVVLYRRLILMRPLCTSSSTTRLLAFVLLLLTLLLLSTRRHLSDASFVSSLQSHRQKCLRWYVRYPTNSAYLTHCQHGH